MKSLTLLLALPGLACAGALAPYPTLDAAATAALADAEALTDAYEAGGTIYECHGTFTYVPPVTQNKRTRVDVDTYGAPGCELVAYYHTHPRGDARFSVDDIAGICNAHSIGYLKPRGGPVLMFDCRNLKAGAIQAAMHGNTRVSMIGEQM